MGKITLQLDLVSVNMHIFIFVNKKNVEELTIRD